MGETSDQQEILIAEIYAAGEETRKLASRSFTARELRSGNWHYLKVTDGEGPRSYLLKLQQPDGMDEAVIPFKSTLNNSIPGTLYSVNGIRVDGNLYLRCIPGLDNLPAGTTLTSSGPFRGRKIMVYEGGIRVPLIFVWPEEIQAGHTIGTPVAHIDLLPTLSAFMGIESLPSVDGVSLHDLIMNGSPIDSRELYWHYPHYMFSNGGEAVRDDRYKYIEFYNDGRKELYDLELDPGEKRNIIEENGEIAEELKGKLYQWLEGIDASMPSPAKE
jgi:hypothetical protein